MRTPVLLSTLLVAACGGGGDGSTTTITLDTIGPPDLVAFKLGTGDWQVLEPDGNLYEITVDEPYIVAVACNDLDDLFDTYLFARTPEDDPDMQAPCTGNGPALDGSVQGTLVQTGEINIGFANGTVTEPNGAFDVPASAGTHDLVALTDTGIAIRRDVEVAGATAITPAIDVDAEGSALVSAGFTATNLASDESPFASARLVTAADTFVTLGFGAPDELLIAPDSVLGEEDSQSVRISASRDELDRAVFVADVRSATARSLELPEYLSGVTLTETSGTVSASWGTLPDHDTLALSIDQIAGPVIMFHILEMSAAYAEAMGTSVALDLEIPGFDPAGEIDMTMEYSRTFTAEKLRDGIRASSSLFEAPNAPSEKRSPSKRASLKPAIRDRFVR